MPELNVWTIGDRIPAPFANANIACTMLFPGDKNSHNAYFLSRFVHLSEQLGKRPVPTTWDDFRRQQEFERDILLSDNETEKRELDSYRFGFVAGMLLYHIVGYTELDPAKANLGRLKAALVQELSKDSPESVRNRRISVKTIDNSIWPRFKPVAPLWAAYFYFARRELGWPFPCPIARLWDFLSVSEEFRRRAEGLRTKGSPQATFLAPDVAFRVPNSINLPPVTLKWLV